MKAAVSGQRRGGRACEGRADFARRDATFGAREEAAPRSAVPALARLRALAVAVCVCVSLVIPASAREIYGLSEKELGLYSGSAFLAGWRVPEARQVVDRLLARSPGDPEARSLEAHLLFFEGRYGDSLRALDRLGERGRFRELVASTVQATRGFSSRKSEHFQVSWGNPKDEVLAEPALQALEQAYAAVSRSLGFAPQGVVRIELYPTVASFTAVSTLTRREVETSGTIGLCKFDRLMITSPRATLWGYRWRDTLCHEYAHLAIYRLSRGTAPIWIHEGIAKYLEESWRGRTGELEPASQALLARRLESGKLISLEAMSPSVAKLPSAEDTALAFAQVGTMMRFLVEEKGIDALGRLLERLAEGRSDREALAAVWPGGLSAFDEAWRAWVRTLPLRKEAIQVLGLELAEGGKAEAEPGTIPDPGARDLARLGDMLRGRGRMAAAAAEYAKAFALDPSAPGVASRQALARLALGRFEEALAATRQGLELYPDLAVLWVRQGQALAGLGRHADAAAAFREAVEVNPFDPGARGGLLAEARALGDEAEVKRQRWALGVLGR
ncbi:MAG: tetratricopeptide repeat protein [Deltaproteobacteria bacterium]|nr:tetratricopeptide repeat protein [Deltaproteobacteria bacterium]